MVYIPCLGWSIGSDTATVTVTFENGAPVAADDSVTAVAGQRTVSPLAPTIGA